MPYRKLTEKEISEIDKKIKEAEEKLGLYQQYIDALKRKIIEWQWYSEDKK